MGDDGLNIINLSDYKLSDDEIAILSKGLTFCPSSNIDTFEVIKDLHLFARKLILKSLYAKPKQANELSKKENQAIDDLVSLLEDQEQKDLIDNINIESLLAMHTTPITGGIQGKSLLKKKSNKFPSLNLNSNLKAFISMTTREIENLKRKDQSPDNLSDIERNALETLSS